MRKIERQLLSELAGFTHSLGSFLCRSKDLLFGLRHPACMKKTELSLALCILCLFLITSVSAHDEVGVTTQRYDNARTGQNLSETILSTSNVSRVTFGKVFTRAVDDEIYAQPLYMSNVTVPDAGVRNVLYVATVNNTVYAFDADDPGAAAPLWRVDLTSGAPGGRPVKAVDVGHGCEDERGRQTYADFSGRIGIVGTPAIDASTQTLYVVARTRES